MVCEKNAPGREFRPFEEARDAQRESLAEIEHVMWMWRRVGFGPRSNFAIMVATVATIAASVFGLVVFGQQVDLVLLGVPVFSVVLILVRLLSKRPVTWAARVDQLLVVYGPVDQEALKTLQNLVLQFGELTFQAAEHWLKLERKAVNERFPAPRPRMRSAFARRAF